MQVEFWNTAWTGVRGQSVLVLLAGARRRSWFWPLHQTGPPAGDRQQPVHRGAAHTAAGTHTHIAHACALHRDMHIRVCIWLLLKGASSFGFSLVFKSWSLLFIQFLSILLTCFYLSIDFYLFSKYFIVAICSPAKFYSLLSISVFTFFVCALLMLLCEALWAGCCMKGAI